MAGPLKIQNLEPLADFLLQAENGKLEFHPGVHFPDRALDYIKNYIQKTHKYKNILKSETNIRFSLYQPDLTTPAGIRSIYFRLKRKFEGLRLPAVATIGVTKDCQCTCEHCSADYHMVSKNKNLSIQEFKKAFAQMSKLGVNNIILLGGEPLINKNICSLIESVDKSLTTVTMFTNGELLTKDKCSELKKSGLSGIFVSLDSPLQKEHDVMRARPGLFLKAVDGIQNALGAGIPVAISSYLTTERIEKNYFEKIMSMGRELDANEVTFFDAIPVGRLQNGECTFLTLFARKQIQKLTNFYRKQSDYPALAPQSILTSSIGSSFCFAGNTQFYLSATGEFCPCDFTPLSIGQFPEKSIAELWHDLIHCDLYKRRSKTCRMQSAEFRKKTIERIPEGTTLPYQIHKLN